LEKSGAFSRLTAVFIATGNRIADGVCTHP